MARMIVPLAILVAVAAVSAQDPNFQQGLSVHNQQIQEHLRKEAEVQRLSGGAPAPRPQQQYNQYQQQPQQYQSPREDDGQYRPELYENQNSNAYARASNPQENYQAGIQAHQAQIQNHLRQEASFQPQQGNQLGASVSDPAYQQGLQLHQQQIQHHLRQEQQHGGPQQAYQSQQQSYQAPQQAYQPRPQQYSAPPQYQNNARGGGGGADQVFQSGIQLHMQQLLEHSRAEQQQQAAVGQASQYHQSQQPQQNYRG